MFYYFMLQHRQLLYNQLVLKDMKQLLLFSGLLVSSFSMGQSIALYDSLGNDLLDDTLKMVIDVSQYDIEAGIALTNTSGSTKNINVTRTEVDVLEWTSGYICWGSCTGVVLSGNTPVLTPAGYVPISAGQSLPANSSGFVLHYDPNWNAGTSLWKVKFYDVDNVADSSITYVEITSVEGLSVEENSKESSLSFNPESKELFVGGTVNKNLDVFDLQGRKVLSESLLGRVSLSGLTTGVYIAKLGEETLKFYLD